MRSILLSVCMALMLLVSGCGLFSSSDTVHTPPPVAEPARTSTVNPEAEELFAKAHVLWKGGDICSDPAMAVFLLDKAIALQAEYADAYMWRGLAYSEMGKDEEAFADLTQAIRQDPSATRYAYRALGLIRQGNLGGAKRDLDQSLKMDDTQYRAWNFRGVASMMENNPEAACTDFKQACARGDCSGIDAAKKQGLCR